MSDEILALVDGDTIRSPRPGWFRCTVAPDHLVAPGDVIGELDVLGHVAHVIAPRVRGFAKLEACDGRRAVAYGAVLLRVVAGAGDIAAEDGNNAGRGAHVADGLLFRAPTSGRFYGRASPDKPPFVTAGVELATGATVCLLEVMKTFHRVAYGGADVPTRARVREVLVAEGADVNAGDPLLALDAV